jgi:hypothetical protein
MMPVVADQLERGSDDSRRNEDIDCNPEPEEMVVRQAESFKERLGFAGQ